MLSTVTSAYSPASARASASGPEAAALAAACAAARRVVQTRCASRLTKGLGCGAREPLSSTPPRAAAGLTLGATSGGPSKGSSPSPLPALPTSSAWCTTRTRRAAPASRAFFSAASQVGAGLKKFPPPAFSSSLDGTTAQSVPGRPLSGSAWSAAAKASRSMAISAAAPSIATTAESTPSREAPKSPRPLRKSPTRTSAPDTDTAAGSCTSTSGLAPLSASTRAQTSPMPPGWHSTATRPSPAAPAAQAASTVRRSIAVEG
mmetsp:Transcript_34971/g.109927  ORF Transcript_34971/g.109927 Transcript_34971/m.109927 type:complete len:261 (-) Transcript_34971:91-873(-)